MDLQTIVEEIRHYPGITRKHDIRRVVTPLAEVADYGFTEASFGEDAAVLRYGGQYLLLAADGIWSGLISANPYGAGKASVMVSVNDIYAMGGRPLAMVNVLGVPDDRLYDDIVRGICKGCQKYRVPMVGGHLHPDSAEVSLSVAIMGTATHLLRSTNARPGQDLVFAVDLEGRGYQCRPVLSWDTNSGKTTEQVLYRMEVLPLLAEQGLCQTCKDVSNGGLLGTLGLLLESSGCGARVDLARIACPSEFAFVDWLKAFLSFGFVLSTDAIHTPAVLDRFAQRGITASVIGTITDTSRLELTLHGTSATLFDFAVDHVAGRIA